MEKTIKYVYFGKITRKMDKKTRSKSQINYFKGGFPFRHYFSPKLKNPFVNHANYLLTIVN